MMTLGGARAVGGAGKVGGWWDEFKDAGKDVAESAAKAAAEKALDEAKKKLGSDEKKKKTGGGVRRQDTPSEAPTGFLAWWNGLSLPWKIVAVGAPVAVVGAGIYVATRPQRRA